MTFLDAFRQLGLLIGLPIAIVAGASAAIIVIARDWRPVLIGYALLSVMLALLLSRVIPVEWALLQVLVGALVAIMLYLSASQLRGLSQPNVPWRKRWPQVSSLTGFRLVAVVLAAGAFILTHDQVHLPLVEPIIRDTILWLAVIGLLGLGLHEEPLHAGLSLLCVIGGFSLLLFSLTQRRMLVGLLGGGQVLLGLAIAYLMLSRGLASASPTEDEPAQELRA
jgi:hypothetical protein